VQSTLAPTN